MLSEENMSLLTLIINSCLVKKRLAVNVIVICSFVSYIENKKIEASCNSHIAINIRFFSSTNLMFPFLFIE